MSDFETLLESFTERYPHLVLSMTGPWSDLDGVIEEEPWIANFKNRSMHFQQVHPGSRGATMKDALAAGIAYLETSPERAQDYYPRTDQRD
ncbi:hypothetical protein O9X98_08290 [Agrobacterium salinitolerans]|nr:hypothetical protein [Agrobacterium salinitolerans]